MFALSTVFAALFLQPIAEPTDTKTELAKWQGTWEVELQLSDGQEKPAKERNISKVVVKDDVWEVHFKGNADPIKGKMKLSLDGKIKGLDVTVALGKDEVVYRSIYLIDDDRAVLRVGDGNDQRPKDFSTSTGSKSGAIMIYTRVKK